MIKHSLQIRLARIEAHHGEAPRSRPAVVWLDSAPPSMAQWEATVAALAAAGGPQDKIVVLPRKAASAAHWAAECLRTISLPPVVEEERV